MHNPRLWLGGGIAGIVGICCGLVAITVSFPDNQLGTSASLIVISVFPVFGMIFSYALYSFVADQQQGPANRLGFVFAVTAFTTLLAMVVVQIAVVSSIAEITHGLDDLTARALRRGLRMIDLGLDVTWDILIGAALICWGIAMRRCGGLGLGWGIPSGLFGVALIGLNASTFPWPPANRGLFDIGPVIALFMLALSARLAMLGRRALGKVAT